MNNNKYIQSNITYLTALIPMIGICGIQLLDNTNNVTPSYHLYDFLLVICVVVLIAFEAVSRPRKTNGFLNLLLYVSLLVYVIFSFIIFERIGIDIGFGGLADNSQFYFTLLIIFVFIISLVFDLISNLKSLNTIFFIISINCLFDYICIKLFKSEINNIIFINMISVKWISTCTKNRKSRKS